MLPKHFPEPRVFRPGGGEPSLRWGIVGPGWIAGEFARALLAHTRQTVTVVGSRSLARASSFAADFGIERAVGSVEQLVDHADVDVVYVATPPSSHLEVGLAAINAGKHVLVEKPFASSLSEAQALAEAARERGVFIMEAMWSRYLPQASVIRSLLSDGVFGEVRSVFADHGQAIPDDGSHRMYRAELGGGALLDLGVYPAQFASMVLGAPERIDVSGSMTSTGVDASSTIVADYAGGSQAVLYSSMLNRTPTSAAVSGTEALLSIDGPFYTPTSMRLTGVDYFGPTLHWEDPTGLRLFDALSWEATALAHFVGEGRTESPLHNLDETIAIMSLLDAARSQVRDANAYSDQEGRVNV